MKSLISIWDTTANFWEVNPNFKTLEFFRDVYAKDKQKKKRDSATSKKMWFIASFMDFGSDYRDLADDPTDRHGKQQLVSSNITGDKKYWETNQEDLQEYFDAYTVFCLTFAQQAMLKWRARLEKRDKVLDETEYIVGMTDASGKLCNSNMAVLDKMNVDTGKIWAEYFKIQEIIDAEGAASSVKGGSEESGSDTGQI
jgi:hypothetical protein